jgi:hypothetical protein
MFERRYRTTLFDLIFELAGGSGGRAGRVRLWSAIVLVLMAGLAVASGFFVLTTSSTEVVSAAKIEGGFNPRVTHRSRGQTYRERYQITGRLAELDSVAFKNRDVAWRCAPLVSDADSRPHVYYVATETSYRRARAENRFAGELYRGTDPYVVDGAKTECQSPLDAYLLVDDGSFRTMKETSRSLLTMAAVIGAIALIAFLLSLRAQLDEPAPPSPLDD